MEAFTMEMIPIQLWETNQPFSMRIMILAFMEPQGLFFYLMAKWYNHIDLQRLSCSYEWYDFCFSSFKELLTFSGIYLVWLFETSDLF